MNVEFRKSFEKDLQKILDTDSGTDKRINYLVSSVYLWQNPCLAFFEVNSATPAIILASD